MDIRTDYSSRIFPDVQQEDTYELDLNNQSKFTRHIADHYQDELYKQFCNKSRISFDISIQDDSKLWTLKSFGPSESCNSPDEVSKDIQLFDIRLESYSESSPFFGRRVSNARSQSEFLQPFELKNSSEFNRSSCDFKLLDSKRVEEDTQKYPTTTDISESLFLPSKISEFSYVKMENTDKPRMIDLNSSKKLPIIKKGEKLPVLQNKSEDEHFKSFQLSRSGNSVTELRSPSLKYRESQNSPQRIQSSDVFSPVNAIPLTKERKLENIYRQNEPLKRIMISSESEKSFHSDLTPPMNNLSRGNSSQDPINSSEGGLNNLLSNRKTVSNRSGGSSRSSSASITLKERRRKLNFDKPVARLSLQSSNKHLEIHDSALLEKSRESSGIEEDRNPTHKAKRSAVNIKTSPEILSLERIHRDDLISPVKTVSITKRINLNLKLPSSSQSETSPKSKISKTPKPQPNSHKSDKLIQIESLETETLNQRPQFASDVISRNILGDIPEVTDSSYSREYTSRTQNHRNSHRSDVLSSHYEDSCILSNEKKPKNVEFQLPDRESHYSIDDKYTLELKKKKKSSRKRKNRDESKYRQYEIPPSDIQVYISELGFRQKSSDGLCDTESEELHFLDIEHNINSQLEEEKTYKKNKRNRKIVKQHKEIDISPPSIEPDRSLSKKHNSKHNSKHRSKKKLENQETTVNFHETYEIADKDIPMSRSISYSNTEHNSLIESPIKSYQELFNRLNSEETPLQTSKRKPHKTNNRPWIQKLFLCCFVENPRVSRHQYSVISLIDAYSSLNFDEHNSLHLSILSTLLHQLSDSVDLTSYMSEEWTKLGFKTPNPISELKEVNLLSLINLSFFSLSSNSQLKFILQTSKSPKSRFELISTSITISNHAYLTFKSGSLYKLMKNSDPWYFQNIYYTGVFLWWFNLYMTKSKVYTLSVLFLKTFEHANKHPKDMLTLGQQNMSLIDNN